MDANLIVWVIGIIAVLSAVSFMIYKQTTGTMKVSKNGFEFKQNEKSKVKTEGSFKDIKKSKISGYSADTTDTSDSFQGIEDSEIKFR